MPDQSAKKVYNFDKFWQFCPVSRPTKETVKTVLFSLFPMIFRNWVVYDNWNSARLFWPEGYALFSRKFFADMRRQNYVVRFPFEINKKNNARSEMRLALVIHAFYPDVFKEILNKITLTPGMGLFITTSSENYDQISALTCDLPVHCHVEIVENRGRDILPFLQILPLVENEGYDLVLKLHTKKSNHLNRKELWRHDLVDKLTGGNALSRWLSVFQTHPRIGMVGPAGHILPMQLYYGANAQIVRALSDRMNIDPMSLKALCFAAGSMFYARMEALKPIMVLELKKEMFEEENAQVDGTLAHAVERAFSLGLLKTKTILVDTDFKEDHPSLTVNRNHYFTL
jgi:lipopolysaccharide biosynthesis protein